MPEISDAELAEFKAAKEERDNLKKSEEERKKRIDDQNKKRREGGKGTPPPKADDKDDDDLGDKVRRQKEENEKRQGDNRRVESALKFNLGVEGFAKEHADLLPASIPEILKQAARENYDSAEEQAASVKIAIVKEFFQVKENRELLTRTQANALDEFEKLTKTGKEEKVGSIYENIFEPALETSKRVRKATELGKSRNGVRSGNKTEEGYKQRLIDGAKRAHLGEKGTS